MGGKQSSNFQLTEIICPKCPLTPIISISLNSEGILTCEYRCPFMHFGQIPLKDLPKDKENKHGKVCERCVASKESEQNSIINEDLLYCGTCKQFICSKCRPDHDKEKESHKVLVPNSAVRYTCLEHGKIFIGYCFTCLISICKDCKRHNNHCKKLFEEFYPEEEFLYNFQYYTGDYNNYLKSFKRCKGMNKEHFADYKKRCQLLLDLANYLKNNFDEKAKQRKLNGETLINLLNVVCFNFKADNLDTNNEFMKYCKTHLILFNRPISDICTFSKTKSDYNISKFELEDFKFFESNENEKPEYFKYSSIGNHITYCLGSCVYFLSTKKEGNENKGFKIRLDSKISSFNIINKNMLCICCGKLYLYQLSQNPPYFTEYKYMPVMDLFIDPVLEVVGNLDKNLVVRTNKELLVVNDKKKKGQYEIVVRTNLEDINKGYPSKLEIPLENEKKKNYDYDYYGYGNIKKTKVIDIIKKVITSIKGIWEDYIITIENGVITSRNLTDLKIISTLKSHTNVDCLVFNGNVLIYNAKNILFYSIPNLEKVSTLTVDDYILSFNIVNKKTLIVVQARFIEQFETNTWKRLWRQISFGIKAKNLEKLMTIGAGKQLFFYDKQNNVIYEATRKENGENKKNN